MSLERARQSIQRLESLLAGKLALRGAQIPRDFAAARELFESQLYCRLVDAESHELRARDQGYYTICSAGHEGNAVLGRLTRATDPALLHYRSGAFYIERARQRPDVDAVFDLLLSLVASADDPISGGRHKVFGSIALGIPPQTSTIGSHLPKAVGMAIAIDRAAQLAVASPYPPDSIVLCSFGDASMNHSTAQGAFNAACWAAYQHLPVPIVFVCEDNGLGISVRTPPGWVENRMRAMPGLIYRRVDGRDLGAVWNEAQSAVQVCREKRMPVFLHMFCERLWGHAGTDVDTEYRTADEIEKSALNDPVLLTAQGLLESGASSAGQLLEVLAMAKERVRKLSAEAVRRPKLTNRLEIMAPIAPEHPKAVAAEARRSNYGPPPADSDRPRPLGQAIRMALTDLMQKYPQMLTFGEDVAQKGGVYGVTLNLRRQFGAKRVFNTLLDEQTILGLAIGAGQLGLLPVPEIQFLAYVHNAEDQLRGEAATLSFFSRGQLKNPMVVRVAGLGYQKGFGGHFHNDNSLAVLRDLPGVIVAVPSRGDDAAKMLRTCLAAAKVDGRVCVFLEPIALYPIRDLFPEDGSWSFPLPPQDQAIDIGEVGVYGADGPCDLVIFTYGNGVPMSLRARERLSKKGLTVRIVDLRWIAPLPEAAIRLHASAAPRVLVVDECRRSGNVSEAIGTVLFEHEPTRKIQFGRVTGADSFIPLADASKLVLPDEDEIYSAAIRLCEGQGRGQSAVRTGTQLPS